MDANRRQFFRMMMRFPVACRRLRPGGEGAERFDAETVDLSVGGVRIVTDRSVSAGDRIELEMRLGEPPTTLDAEAHVVRVETAHDGRSVCALAFDSLDPSPSAASSAPSSRRSGGPRRPAPACGSRCGCR